MKEIIQLKDVSKTFKVYPDAKQVLSKINLSIDENDFIVIIGKSGSGKSTLLNILGMIDDFSEGKFLYKSKNVKNLDEKEKAHIRNKEIGFIYQQFNLINNFTVYQNVELPLKYSSIHNKKIRKAMIEKQLTLMGLLNKKEYYPYQLSGGQQQRVAIARAMVNNNNIILADEPTGSLDTETGNEVINLLRKLNENPNPPAMLGRIE